MTECLCTKQIINENTPKPQSSLLLPNMSSFSNNIFYSIEPEDSNDFQRTKDIFFKKVKFISTNYNNITYPFLSTNSYLIKKANSNNELVVLQIKNNRHENQSKYTLLYSHGNSVTLGQIYPSLFNLSALLKCNVISYDYSGYGCSTGTINESQINKDITNVVSFITQVFEIPINNLILFGDSFGTTPTIYLSSQEKYQNLAGIILISPSSTGSYFSFINSLKQENKRRNKKPHINNDSAISNIICPIFLIHGHKDLVIPVSQSLHLSEELKHSGNSYCWFPKKGTHDNIINELRRKFYRKFMYFLDLIERFQKQARINNVNNSDLNVRPTINVGNISIGKPREENYISVNEGRPTANMVMPNPISGPEVKMFDSSSFEGNDSSNFIVLNNTERVTNAGVQQNVEKENK